jgi:hypothetical protein
MMPARRGFAAESIPSDEARHHWDRHRARLGGRPRRDLQGLRCGSKWQSVAGFPDPPGPIGPIRPMGPASRSGDPPLAHEGRHGTARDIPHIAYSPDYPGQKVGQAVQPDRVSPSGWTAYRRELLSRRGHKALSLTDSPAGRRGRHRVTAKAAAIAVESSRVGNGTAVEPSWNAPGPSPRPIGGRRRRRRRPGRAGPCDSRGSAGARGCDRGTAGGPRPGARSTGRPSRGEGRGRAGRSVTPG